jgi:hypothetical protein
VSGSQQRIHHYALYRLDDAVAGVVYMSVCPADEEADDSAYTSSQDAME